MTRRSLPIAAIKPGDAVTIHLTGRAVERVNAWGGEVVAVDGVAVRMRASWSRFCLSPGHAEGEHVIPWSRIDRIRAEAPAAEEGAAT